MKGTRQASTLVFDPLGGLRVSSGTDVSSGVSSLASQPYATSSVPIIQKVRLASVHCATLKDHDQGGGQGSAVGVYFWPLPFSVFLRIHHQAEIKCEYDAPKGVRSIGYDVQLEQGCGSCNMDPQIALSDWGLFQSSAWQASFEYV